MSVECCGVQRSAAVVGEAVYAAEGAEEEEWHERAENQADMSKRQGEGDACIALAAVAERRASFRA
jgi:hypothetical protein